MRLRAVRASVAGPTPHMMTLPKAGVPEQLAARGARVGT
jgi:hypothetical protein